MIPIVVVTPAWAAAHQMSYPDIASLLDVDVQGAVQAADQLCPQCRRPALESAIKIFVPDPATSTAERVAGRQTVQCLCGTAYWYPAIHEVGAATTIYAGSVAVTPGTGAIKIDGQEALPKNSADGIAIHVHEDITVESSSASAGGGTCGPTVVIS